MMRSKNEVFLRTRKIKEKQLKMPQGALSLNYEKESAAVKSGWKAKSCCHGSVLCHLMAPGFVIAWRTLRWTVPVGPPRFSCAQSNEGLGRSVGTTTVGPEVLATASDCCKLSHSSPESYSQLAGAYVKCSCYFRLHR